MENPGEWQALRSYLKTEFGVLRKELSDISQKLGVSDASMSKDVFERRVSNVVTKLERRDSQGLSPNPISNTRRLSFQTLSLSNLSPRPPPSFEPALETKYDSEVESVSDAEEQMEIQDLHTTSSPDLIVNEASMPSLPGTIPEKDATLSKSFSKKFQQSSAASQKWAESMEGQQKMGLFDHKGQKNDKFGRGMGLVSRAQDQSKTTTFKSTLHQKCHKLVTSGTFELLTIFLISSSALQIGLSTNWMAENLVGKTSEVHRIIEVVYCIIFTSELTLRLFAYRLEFFTQVRANTRDRVLGLSWQAGHPHS